MGTYQLISPFPLTLPLLFPGRAVWLWAVTASAVTREEGTQRYCIITSAPIIHRERETGSSVAVQKWRRLDGLSAYMQEGNLSHEAIMISSKHTNNQYHWCNRQHTIYTVYIWREKNGKGLCICVALMRHRWVEMFADMRNKSIVTWTFESGSKFDPNN